MTQGLTFNSPWRRWKSRIVIGLMGAALALCLVPLASLLFTLVAKGAPVLSLRFLTGAWKPVGESGGIAHAILGSLCLLGVASLFAVPLGLANGVYLAQRGGTTLARLTRLVLDVMTGVPAIIVGVFIYTVVVRRSGLSLGTGFSMIAGGLSLALIMLPIFARTSEQALRAIPRAVDEAGLALGLTRRRVVMRIVLRSAMPAVLTGMFLSLARVAGEAAPLLFTAFGSNDWPGSPMQPVGSLPQLLFDYARQPFEQLVRQAWGAALVLVTMTLMIRVLTSAYAHWRYAGQG
jgi:phosphate transport system permease protein